MIRAGINIGNSKISCVVCDFKNINKIKILSLIDYPNKELKAYREKSWPRLFKTFFLIFRTQESGKNGNKKIFRESFR